MNIKAIGSVHVDMTTARPITETPSAILYTAKQVINGTTYEECDVVWASWPTSTGDDQQLPSSDEPEAREIFLSDCQLDDAQISALTDTLILES